MDYRITYSTESGRFVNKVFSGDSIIEAVEAFEFWADGCNEVLEFEDMEEVLGHVNDSFNKIPSKNSVLHPQAF